MLVNQNKSKIIFYAFLILFLYVLNKILQNISLHANYTGLNNYIYFQNKYILYLIYLYKNIYIKIISKNINNI